MYRSRRPDVLASLAVAQSFPAKPVTIIVPFSTGGPSDAHVRQFAAAFSRQLKVPVIVDDGTVVFEADHHGRLKLFAFDGQGEPRALTSTGSVTASTPIAGG